MREKSILFICYWGINDPLTRSVVLPHIKILLQIKSIAKVVLVTIERDQHRGRLPQNLIQEQNLLHHPVYSYNLSHSFFNKILDFILFPKEIKRLIKQEKIDYLVASGAMAGALANKVAKSLHIPFYIVFEPHAQNMLEAGEWSKYGIKYIIQRKWEKEQHEKAAGLILVSKAFKNEIASLRPKIAVQHFGNFVSLAKFQFSLQHRDHIREQLNGRGATIGIYVGKYGGLYYTEEAFAIYKRCFSLIPDFRLIILSPQEQRKIQQQLQRQQIDTSKVFVAAVPHEEVPQYLSAADFGFATYKPGPSKKYLSPVKIGEYWANGLPVLLTEGVGDDSDIIQNEGGGATFNLQQEGSVDKAIGKILQIIQNPNHRQEIPELAKKYRSPERVREAYEYFFGQQGEDKG